MDRVSPTGKSRGPLRRASTPSTWARHSASLTARRRPPSRTAGGKTSSRYPMVATTLGSLRVQAQPTRSPRCWPTRSQNRAKRSGASAASHPPRSDSHRGMVKWLSVTTGDEAELVAAGAVTPVVVERRASTTPPRRARSGSTPPRTGRRPARGEATRSRSSGHSRHESQASPLDSRHGVPGACSKAHQSLLVLPPSIWWAAVAVPHRNPSGKSAFGTATP